MPAYNMAMLRRTEKEFNLSIFPTGSDGRK